MNRSHLTPLVFCLALLGLAGCKPAATTEEFPQAVADGWIAAFNSGDAAGLALMYGSHAEILPPDHPIVSGNAEIEEYWTSFNPGNVRIEVSQVETMKLGDHWYREGTYKRLYEAEGEPRVGKFIELWSKEGSAWLIQRHMWSPNAPGSAPIAESDATG